MACGVRHLGWQLQNDVVRRAERLSKWPDPRNHLHGLHPEADQAPRLRAGGFVALDARDSIGRRACAARSRGDTPSHFVTLSRQPMAGPRVARRVNVWGHRFHRTGDRAMPVNLNRIGQIALSVRDVDRAEAFYRDTLGLRKLYRFGDLAFFDCAGVRLLLEKTNDVAGEAHGSPIYFACADIALTARELNERGITFTHPIHLV